MEVIEIDSFVEKFKSLWKSGFNAHLAMDSFTGHVSLHVNLNHAYHRQKTNSRDRRRARRAAERAGSNSDAAGPEMVTTEKSNDIQSTEVVESSSSDTVKVIENIDTISQNENLDNIQEIERDAAEFIKEPMIDEAKCDTVEPMACSVDQIQERTLATENTVENITIVHAVATFENCPTLDIGQDEINSLLRYIKSEDHLARNIDKIDVHQCGRREVAAMIHVKTKNLWEGARPYIWKHLGGQNFWDRSNGTKIRLTKIHVK